MTSKRSWFFSILRNWTLRRFDVLHPLVTPNKKVEIADANDVKHVRELLDSSCHWVKRLFALAYNNTTGNDQVSADSYKKYFLPS